MLLTAHVRTALWRWAEGGLWTVDGMFLHGSDHFDQICYDRPAGAEKTGDPGHAHLSLSCFCEAGRDL